MNKEERMKEILKASPDFGKGVGYKMCVVDELHDIKELEKENELAKSLLYCTKRTCDNCGFVNCENFQRQRKSEPCAMYISYRDRIKNLAHENDVLRESYNNSEMNLGYISAQLTEARDLVLRLSTCLEGHHNNNFEYELLQEAEQFLKESEE